MDTLAVIIPCFNEEATIPLFYEALSRTLDAMQVSSSILFVDDGSTDATLDTIKTLAARDERVSYLSFSRNFGKEAALYAGFCNAPGDYVAMMDADLQDPPSLLPTMLDRLQNSECDCVAARRGNRAGEPLIRSWFSKAFYRTINRLSDTEIADGARDFRMMKRSMVDSVVAMGEQSRFSKGIFGWVGFTTEWVSYNNVERVAGETKWSFGKLARYAVDGITSFSQTPLSVAFYLGIMLTALSLTSIVFIVARRIAFGDPVSGWASTISVIIFIGGVEIAILGIIGQYLAKVYIETKQRPHYIVKESNRDNPTLIK